MIINTKEYIMKQEPKTKQKVESVEGLEAELKPYAKKLKDSFQTEAYARIKGEIATLKEQLTELSAIYGEDSYVDSTVTRCLWWTACRRMRTFS